MMKSIVATMMLLSNALLGFEVDIKKGPAIDAGPNTFISSLSSIKDGTGLMDFLGGENEIERILIGTPHMNADQINFTKELVRNRFKKSTSIDSQKESWHYAPYTMGTVYWEDGRKSNFSMYLSGISISGHLFAIPRKSNVEQND